jgi:hypothetical protein
MGVAGVIDIAGTDVCRDSVGFGPFGGSTGRSVAGKVSLDSGRGDDITIGVVELVDRGSECDLRGGVSRGGSDVSLRAGERPRCGL